MGSSEPCGAAALPSRPAQPHVATMTHRVGTACMRAVSADGFRSERKRKRDVTCEEKASVDVCIAGLYVDCKGYN